ncbi:MAG: DUF222 domain-containing protein [Egibacteraceae bacterium]
MRSAGAQGSHTDDRTYAQRIADALVELASRALDGGELPKVAVQRPHVILISPRGDVEGRAARLAGLDGVGPVSATTAQILCCDAETTQLF